MQVNNTVQIQEMPSEKKKELVYIVDGSGYIFRAYYAVQPLSTSAGFPTNALFGFTRMLLKLLQTAGDDAVVMVFDSGRETFRTELYAEYKANRQECPEDLKQQMPYFRAISKALGLPILEEQGFEADDVIGTLVERFKGNGVEQVIVSADKDLMQLVGEGVTIWDTMRDRRFQRAEVIEKFGVSPEKVVEILGLTGDSSDNIPGIKGIGPKTAAQLIEKFGDIEGVLAAVEAIKEDKSIRGRKKIAEQLESGVDILRLSRRLAEIRRDVPVRLEMDPGSFEILGNVEKGALLPLLRRRSVVRSELEELVQKFEFKALGRELLDLSPRGTAEPEAAADYRIVWKGDFPLWLSELQKQEHFAFDLETTSLDVLEARLIGAAFCWDDSVAYYVPLDHHISPAGPGAADAGQQVAVEDFLNALTPILSNPRVKKVGQNLKYDISVFGRYGVEVRGLAFDSMVASYVLHPEGQRHNLGALSERYLKLTPLEYKDVVGDRSSFAEVEIERACRYAAEDAHFAWLLSNTLRVQLEQEDLLPVYENVELPLVSVLAKMEQRGILLDGTLFQTMSEELGSRLTELTQQIYEHVGHEFNVNSPKQLATVLFDELNLPKGGIKKTKTGYTTNSAALERLVPFHSLPSLLLEYRMLHKLKSTYVDVLPAQVSPVSGRLHTRFNQVVTATGRLSSSEPNLQNIPIQTEVGRKVRAGFIAGEGKKLISADYSQIELRLLAHLSDDGALKECFERDVDIHARTARQILNLDPQSEVSAEDRRMGKTINFGLIYGMGAFRLARELGIPVHLAQAYIDSYFAAFPGVKRYFSNLEAIVDGAGEMRTIAGRRRLVSEIQTSGRDRGFARRAALNAPIQGSAADVIKMAMIELERQLTEENLDCRILLQIHDELVFECAESQVERAVELIRSVMESVVKLNVPLKVDVGVGNNWQEAH